MCNLPYMMQLGLQSLHLCATGSGPTNPSEKGTKVHKKVDRRVLLSSIQKQLDSNGEVWPLSPYVHMGEKELFSTLMIPSCDKRVTSEQKILAMENSAAFKGRESYTQAKRRQEETHRGIVLK